LGDLVQKIQAGDSLVFRTGWSNLLDQPEYRDALPRISEELAHWCAKKHIRTLGVEPPSVADVHNLAELTLIHGILLRGGVIIVEGLCNLDQIKQLQFELMAIPLKIKNGDGAPARRQFMTCLF